MDRPQIIEVLHALGQEPAKTKRQGWVITHCPMPWRHTGESDTHPSFGIKISPNKESRCHCFSCRFSGGLMDVLALLKAKKVEGIDYKGAMQLIAKDGEEAELALTPGDYEEDVHGGQAYKPQPWPESWLDSFPKAGGSPTARKYLDGRDGGPFPDAVIEAFDLRWDSYRKRVGFPFRDFSGRLMGMQGRAISKEIDPRYYQYEWKGQRNPDIWLGEHWVNTDDWVVITESVFDAARVYQGYRNVITPMFTQLPVSKLRRAGGIDYAVLMFDGDVAGREGARQLADGLKKAGTSAVRIIDLPDGMDPGGMSAKLVRKYIRLEIGRADDLLI